MSPAVFIFGRLPISGTLDRVRPLLVVLAVLLLSTDLASAGKQTVDIVQFTPPAAYKKAAWVKEIKKGVHQTYTVIDKEAGTYCRIGIYYSTESKGDLDAEFLREWGLVLKEHAVTGPAQVTDPREENGWRIRAGVATFEFDGKPAFAMLTTFTGYGRTTSIVALTSSEAFFPAIEKFIGSVELKKPAGAAAKTPATSPAAKGAKVEHAEQYMEYNTMLKAWVWKWRYPKSK